MIPLALLISSLAGPPCADHNLHHPFGQSSWAWCNTVFLADPSRGLVGWYSADMRTVHGFFRNLPCAHDVWVSRDGILHVWIETEQGIRIRKIDLATRTPIRDVFPEEVAHPGYRDCPSPALVRPIAFSGSASLSRKVLRLIWRFSPRWSQDPTAGLKWKILPDNYAYSFGPLIPDPQTGRLAPPLEEWVLFLSASGDPIGNPIRVSQAPSEIRVPLGQRLAYVWTRSEKGLAEGARQVRITPRSERGNGPVLLTNP